MIVEYDSNDQWADNKCRSLDSELIISSEWNSEWGSNDH